MADSDGAGGGEPSRYARAVDADVERRDFTLEWNPMYADVAASGDIGYTIGKWTRVVRDSTGTSTTARGTYLTVWRKQANGSWKVVADTGDGDPPG